MRSHFYEFITFSVTYETTRKCILIKRCKKVLTLCKNYVVFSFLREQAFKILSQKTFSDWFFFEKSRFSLDRFSSVSIAYMGNSARNGQNVT